MVWQHVKALQPLLPASHQIIDPLLENPPLEDLGELCSGSKIPGFMRNSAPLWLRRGTASSGLLVVQYMFAVRQFRRSFTILKAAP